MSQSNLIELHINSAKRNQRNFNTTIILGTLAGVSAGYALTHSWLSLLGTLTIVPVIIFILFIWPFSYVGKKRMDRAAKEAKKVLAENGMDERTIHAHPMYFAKDIEAIGLRFGKDAGVGYIGEFSKFNIMFFPLDKIISFKLNDKTSVSYVSTSQSTTTQGADYSGLGNLRTSGSSVTKELKDLNYSITLMLNEGSDRAPRSFQLEFANDERTASVFYEGLKLLKGGQVN